MAGTPTRQTGKGLDGSADGDGFGVAYRYFLIFEGAGYLGLAEIRISQKSNPEYTGVMRDFDQDLDSFQLPTASPALSQILDLVPMLSLDDVGVLQMYLETLNPVVDSDSIDLSVEMAKHLRNTKAVLASTLANQMTPPNQKVAAATAVSKAIAQVTIHQDKIYNIERVKCLEQAVQITMRNHPDAKTLLTTFRETYERLLGAKINERAENPAA